MSVSGQKCRFDSRSITSGLPRHPITGHSQRRSACLKSANKRHHSTPCLETVDGRLEVGVGAPRPRRRFFRPQASDRHSPAVSRLRLRTSLRDVPFSSHTLSAAVAAVGQGILASTLRAYAENTGRFGCRHCNGATSELAATRALS